MNLDRWIARFDLSRWIAFLLLPRLDHRPRRRRAEGSTPEGVDGDLAGAEGTPEGGGGRSGGGRPERSGGGGAVVAGAAGLGAAEKMEQGEENRCRRLGARRHRISVARPWGGSPEGMRASGGRRRRRGGKEAEGGACRSGADSYRRGGLTPAPDPASRGRGRACRSGAEAGGGRRRRRGGAGGSAPLPVHALPPVDRAAAGPWWTGCPIFCAAPIFVLILFC